MADAPGGWELKRGMDQLRADMRDDNTELKADVAGIAAKIDNLPERFVTHKEHNSLTNRVTKLEQSGEKRTDRSITIWLAIGLAALSSLVSIALTIVNALVK